MLTDSGGFQVYSLAHLRKVTDEGVRFRSHLDGSSHFFTPEHSIDVQIALGADICMAFDECTEYPADRPRCEESLRLTMAWARRSLDHFRAHQHEVPWPKDWVPQVSTLRPGIDGRTQSLFGIVQGGMYRDLRRESAERLVEMDFRRLCDRRSQRGRAARIDPRSHQRSSASAAERQTTLRDGRWLSRRNRTLRAHGCGHDGLRDPDSRRASRASVHQRGTRQHQEQAVCGRSRSCSILPATAWSAGDTPAPICAT